MKGHNAFRRKDEPGVMLIPRQEEIDETLAQIMIKRSEQRPDVNDDLFKWQGLVTYYAVLFQSATLPDYCSLFYEVLVFTQENDEETTINSTRQGLLDVLDDETTPSPLPRDEVEERARQDEAAGILPSGWRVVPISVDA